MTRERPGLSPSALFHLLGNSVILRLSDVASGLTPYEEQVPPLSEEKLYPKEKALLDLVVAERMKGCRVLVYATHTGTRDRKPQPATLSMFEWALTLEQEREEEPVGAGR